MTATAGRPRILLDLLPYSPSDGGFTTSIRALLETARVLEEFRFGIVYHAQYREVFSSYPFAQHAVRFPSKLKFFAPLAYVPWVVRQGGYAAAHADISLIPFGTGVPMSMRVHDLYHLISDEKRHSPLLHRGLELLYRRLYTRSIRRASIAAAISECTRRDIARLAGRRGPIPLLPHVVPLPATTPQPRRWPARFEPLRLLFVGSIVPRKNVRALLTALALLRRPWTLELVGNIWWGAEELQLHLGDPRIKVHGFVSDSELQEHFNHAHLLVIPSLYEGFGLPAAEAVCHGCLAVTSRGSAFDEFVPAECRFDPRLPGELAELIERMDVVNYERLFRESFLMVSRYTRANQVENYRAVFRRLLAGKETPVPSP